MSPTREFVIVILLGSFAVAFGRPDVGKAFGRARVGLLGDKLRGHLSTSELRRLPVSLRVSNPDIEGIPIDGDNDLHVYEPIDNLSKPRHASQPAVGATPCHTAEQWEGRASEWDHIQGVNNRFNITFDGTHRRKRIMEDKHAQLPGKRIYEYIMLYDEGIQYVINHNYNTCTVEQLGTWRNFTIPPNSTLEDYYEIGAPGSAFMVQEWSDRIPGRQKESWIGTFTDNGCWPVTEIFMEKDEHQTMIQSVSTKFFDLQAGISSMSVFTPPSFCNTTNTSTTLEQQSIEKPRPVRPRPRALPTTPRARPHSTRRFPNFQSSRLEVPQVLQNQRGRMQGDHSLLEAVLSGDYRQLPEGIDRMTYDTLSKAYRDAIKSGRAE